MALTANKIVKKINDFEYATRDCVAGTLHIFRNALLNSNAYGNVKPSSDAANERFAGVSMEEVNQDSSAAAGDNTVKLVSANSGKAVLLQLVGVTKANIGALAYATADDAVLLAAGTNGIIIGRIVEIETTDYCWIKLNNDLDTDTIYTP